MRAAAAPSHPRLVLRLADSLLLSSPDEANRHEEAAAAVRHPANLATRRRDGGDVTETRVDSRHVAMETLVEQRGAETRRDAPLPRDHRVSGARCPAAIAARAAGTVLPPAMMALITSDCRAMNWPPTHRP